MDIEFKENGVTDLVTVVADIADQYGYEYTHLTEQLDQNPHGVEDTFNSVNPCDGRMDFIRCIMHLEMMDRAGKWQNEQREKSPNNLG